MHAPDRQPVVFRPAELARWLRPRARDSHKGDHGHVLCVGGDLGSGGAIVLCAQAALRCGAGLVSVATRAEHVAALLARQPEAMAHAVDSGDAFAPLLERATVLAIGPGLGRGDWARGLLHAALGTAKPMVLDADALNLLAEQPRAVGDAILTPHPGEAARLIGITTAEVQEGREASARALATSFDAVVVLKGAGTLVAAPDGRMARIDAGNPGMATGGMGDLLTGTIAALRAQGLEAFDAATCGALLHAAAGDAAAAATAMRGLLPVDLLPQLQLLANPG